MPGSVSKSPPSQPKATGIIKIASRYRDLAFWLTHVLSFILFIRCQSNPMSRSIYGLRYWSCPLSWESASKPLYELAHPTRKHLLDRYLGCQLLVSQ